MFINEDLDRAMKNIIIAETEIIRICRKLETAIERIKLLNIDVCYEEWDKIKNIVSKEQNEAYKNMFLYLNKFQKCEHEFTKARMHLITLTNIYYREIIENEYSLLSHDIFDIFLDNWKNIMNNNNHDIELEKKIRKLYIIFQLKNRIGEILDTKRLYFGIEKNITGFIIGKNGVADLQTISLGYKNKSLYYRLIIN